MSDPTRDSSGATASPQATSQYVYAVIPAADAASWAGAEGIDGGVRVVEEGDLAALVSALPPDKTPGRREDLEAHRRVLGRAIERGTTIPMRFGMVMDSDELVRERLLQKHGPELSEMLRDLDGKVQMTVRAFYAEDALLGAVMSANREIARRAAALQGLPEVQTREERIAVGEAVAKAVDERRARDEAALLDRLRPYADDVRVDPAGGDRVALNAQLLVQRERRPELDEAIRDMGAMLKGYVALRYIGPLPPYSFTALSLEPNENED
jgi:hypothetical protein